ncbi:hypothetical protein MSG28_011085 [Choristoneura fumiferana]|uniref:Uncharacterized protein n=1 Tax=Choristoneura fumiferana TaxID=7141 RepID=A0ACC0KQ58_CHOFU|nr:hypothetical protein MSG28_011085 [Choristoneura fumiferana]
MSIPFSGTLRRSGGVVSAIGKQLKAVNLKAAKRITVKFDPFKTANLKKVTLKSGNLTCLELLQLLNKHVSALAPVEQPVSTIQTKSEKKKIKKK